VRRRGAFSLATLFAMIGFKEMSQALTQVVLMIHPTLGAGLNRSFASFLI
jgi:hypothetical protein